MPRTASTRYPNPSPASVARVNRGVSPPTSTTNTSQVVPSSCAATASASAACRSASPGAPCRGLSAREACSRNVARTAAVTCGQSMRSMSVPSSSWRWTQDNTALHVDAAPICDRGDAETPSHTTATMRSPAARIAVASCRGWRKSRCPTPRIDTDAAVAPWHSSMSSATAVGAEDACASLTGRCSSSAYSLGSPSSSSPAATPDSTVRMSVARGGMIQLWGGRGGRTDTDSGCAVAGWCRPAFAVSSASAGDGCLAASDVASGSGGCVALGFGGRTVPSDRGGNAGGLSAAVFGTVTASGMTADAAVPLADAPPSELGAAATGTRRGRSRSAFTMALATIGAATATTNAAATIDTPRHISVHMVAPFLCCVLCAVSCALCPVFRAVRRAIRGFRTGRRRSSTRR